jgi:hypothetical protein
MLSSFLGVLPIFMSVFYHIAQDGYYSSSHTDGDLSKRRRKSKRPSLPCSQLSRSTLKNFLRGLLNDVIISPTIAICV